MYLYIIYIMLVMKMKNNEIEKNILLLTRKSFFTAKMNFFFDSRKFFPRNLSQNSPNAKVFVKNFAFFLARESFRPRKFLLLKYYYIIFIYL